MQKSIDLIQFGISLTTVMLLAATLVCLWSRLLYRGKCKAFVWCLFVCLSVCPAAHIQAHSPGGSIDCESYRMCADRISTLVKYNIANLVVICIAVWLGWHVVLQLYCAQWLGQNDILCGGTANNLVRIVNRHTLEVGWLCNMHCAPSFLTSCR